MRPALDSRLLVKPHFVADADEGLEQAGEFDATYLHIKNQAASALAATSLA